MPKINIIGKLRNEAVTINARRDNSIDVYTKSKSPEIKYNGFRQLKNRIRDVDPYEVMGTNTKSHIVKKRKGE